MPSTTYSPTAVVRVTTEHAGVHYSSLRLFEKQATEALEYSTPPALVTTCTVRLTKPRITLAALTCASCTARDRDDVTEDVFAEACC
jgi:hypothetical protein